MNFSYYMPTRIFFGPGSVQKLGRGRLPGKKALLVTGGSSTTRLGYVDKVRALLAQSGAEVVLYDKVQPNPSLQNVNECAALCRAHGCDFVVGLGGGSSIDTAKATAILAVNDGEYWDYVYGGSGKGKRPPNHPLPIVAITTTAGTGTEADPWTVVTNGEEKIGGGYEGTFPALSIVDPEFMVSVPPLMTAFQGFDALFHAAEGYIARQANPISDMYALKAIELIGKSLAEAVNNGENLDARTDVALANTLAGFVESLSSMASEHGMEHAMSALHHKLPHGAGLIMLSVEYFTFQAAIPECAGRLVDMARALGKKDAADPMDFVRLLSGLQKACHVDGLRMSEYGITGEDFGKYADNAMNTMGGLFKADRRPLTRDEVIAIFQKSFR
ncbi:MAG: iron-containing alcohol dehydrogenase [Intestinibacillus sp.]